MPLSGALERHAANHPENPAFHLEDRVLCYGALTATARRLFAAFSRLAPEGHSAIGPKSRLIAIVTGNHALFPAAFAAATAGNNCAALIDPHLPEPVRRRMIEKLGPDLVVTADGANLLALSPHDGNSMTISEEAALGDPPLPEGNGDDPFLIVFTSGTTADPKPIIRDRRSWRISLETGAPFFGIDATTSTYSPGPLAHGLALYAMTETLLAGGIFYTARHFDAAEAANTIRRNDVRRLVLVPTMLRRLCEGGGAEGVTAITIAGAKLTAADHALCRRTFPGAALREYYGASEIGFMTATAPGDPASSTAVGTAFPGVRLSILDGAGKALPAGETGTIFVESPLVATGYLGAGDGAGLARVGNLTTVGDLGFLEADDTLHLLGRSGGMVLSGGNNIYPSEVEAALLGLPHVRAAHVFGVDHADLGSELVAVIEPGGSALTPDILTAAMTEVLPRYKQPRRLWLCRAMPVTPSGKVEAKTVRQWVAEGSNALERFL
ncbi:class I adenylate-forming enzyme family protein [Shinella kummerowiae]|uniref:class I adenylate-forming enzyme family protein n=1 Tax=Shinella kummerowiae TaxID=417745 RepID=UPI0021B50F31|nr:AMP-binding protein [Shinella kummerowiae]MCT7663014.1 AMP-binding protein [Shinella kummerowiae]